MHDYSRADGFNVVCVEDNRRDGLRIHGDKTQTLQSFMGTGGGNTPIVVHGSQDPIVSDKAHAIGRNQGQENVVGGVRRLTPTEAERLQGFPDSHTDIGWKGKPTPDSHRYKAMGNSMAVPVMRWIGERIQKRNNGEI